MVDYLKDYVWSSYYVNGGNKNIVMIEFYFFYLFFGVDFVS